MERKVYRNSEYPRTYIGMIERAEKNITLINIEKISNALGITLSDLFKFNKK